MEKHPHTVAHLFQKFLQQECTAEELTQLYRYFDIDENTEMLKELILKALNKEVDTVEITAQQPHLSKLFDKIEEKIQASEGTPWYRSLHAIHWTRVAATVMLVASASLFAYRYIKHAPKEQITAQAKGYLQPGTDRAELTLFNGKKIVLNELEQDQLLQEAGITISNTSEGLVIYRVDDDNIDQADHALNTMRTPRGGQYQIILADGTKVWLNASSSLIFPSHFSGNKRSVKLEGEAYFEVAHDAAKPFFVQTAESEVKVLGTSFNVMAYPDEQKSQITLLTGSVHVKRGEEAMRLIPGQQAEIKRKQQGIQMRVVDIEPIIAWKNGIFLFDQSELPQVMRQIGRWYDAEVVYKGEVPEVSLTGMVSRQDSLATLLSILERAGGLHFDVQKNKIMVKQLK
ncbi:FecR family protein [Sphingobacterium gobiense]|uniref:Iron dicitrate transport regulator FecR n=1 Tax=Sphingobacterium gobiense TaxID=1382456 RepID=A0A2S9JL38_9SPHI|nr:FecR family protein [Sphingobacterium gobiense]PRD53854.1 iron dicitrate transport regulator FecR [Sphingobacterium gobiense]